MQRPILALVLLFALLCLAQPAAAFECEIQTNLRNGKHVGDTVISDFKQYCAEVRFQGGGYSVRLEGEPKEFYSKSLDYSYQELLDYICMRCSFQRSRVLTK